MFKYFMKKFKKLYKSWMKFVYFFGLINSKIILTLFYIFIIGFYAIIKKLIMLFIFKNIKQSYWQEVQNPDEEKDYTHQF